MLVSLLLLLLLLLLLCMIQHAMQRAISSASIRTISPKCIITMP
jgi:hypothetical protein